MIVDCSDTVTFTAMYRHPPHDTIISFSITAAKSLKSLMKNRPKRALRGATYTEYVRTHTVLVGECALGGIALAYIGYRIFARYRYKVHRYINKVKGVEEK